MNYKFGGVFTYDKKEILPVIAMEGRDGKVYYILSDKEFSKYHSFTKENLNINKLKGIKLRDLVEDTFKTGNLNINTENGKSESFISNSILKPYWKPLNNKTYIGSVLALEDLKIVYNKYLQDITNIVQELTLEASRVNAAMFSLDIKEKLSSKLKESVEIKVVGLRKNYIGSYTPVRLVKIPNFKNFLIIEDSARLLVRRIKDVTYIADEVNWTKSCFHANLKIENNDIIVERKRSYLHLKESDFKELEYSDKNLIGKLLAI